MVTVDKIKAFHDHPFRLYEGERLNDMVESVREHGILNPVIVRRMDDGYEMLSGHNRPECRPHCRVDGDSCYREGRDI